MGSSQKNNNYGSHVAALIDVCHPCEVHHYRFLYHGLVRDGWRVQFVAKDKDVTLALLRHYQLPFRVLSKNRGGLLQKVFRLPYELASFLQICRHFKPDVVVSAVSLHAAWVCWLRRIPHCGFIDTEPRYAMDRVTLPFVRWKFTSYSYYRALGAGQRRYAGNHELAYLHPDYFEFDPAVYEVLGIRRDEPFVVCRFVAWNASHDIGRKGMSVGEKITFIRELSQIVRVFISSESPLPAELEDFALPTAPWQIHSVLAIARLYVGEGITTASEAAVLGTPAVLINSLKMGYCLEEARYGLLFQYDRLDGEAKAKIYELLKVEKAVFRERHREYMRGKGDVVGFMKGVVEEIVGSRK